METNNIQVLFSRIGLDNVLAYMTQKGWTVEPKRRHARIYFLGDVHEKGERYRLFIPEKDATRHFRSRIQSLVFTLTEIENRHAMEIARDMANAELREASPPEPTPQPTPASRLDSAVVGPPTTQAELPPAAGPRLTPDEQVPDSASSGTLAIRNRRSQALTLSLSNGQPLELRAGDSLHVRGEAQWEIVVTDQGFSFQGPVPQEVAVSAELESTSIRQATHEAMTQTSLACDLSSFWPVAERLDFETAGEGQLTPQLALRQAALVLVDLAPRVHTFEQAAEFLWILAKQLLARGRMGLKFTSSVHPKGLLSVSLSDSPSAPVTLLNWLKTNTCPIG